MNDQTPATAERDQDTSVENEEVLVEDVLVEDLSIDGMCGVY
jgi:mycofactocin precursor